MNQGFWRKWHRWIGIVAAPFLVYAATTGVVLAATEFFGEDEARREQLRDQVSPAALPVPATAWSGPIEKALATAATRAANAPVDKIALEFKGHPSTVIVYLGKPGGGEDRKLVIDATTGSLLREEPYVDKPFLVRVHSGEAWGDGGLVFAMLWGIGLLVIGVSGVVIYWKMKRPGLTGIRRVFWSVALLVASQAA